MRINKSILLVLCLAVVFPSYIFAQGLSWAQGFSNTGIGRATTDANNNLYVIGGTNGTVDVDQSTNVYNITSVGQSAWFLLKEDVAGNFQWAKAFQAKSVSNAGFSGNSSVALDGNGNIYIAGTFRDTVDFDPGPGTFYMTVPVSSTLNLSAFIVKLNPNGDFIWAKQMVGTAGSGMAGDAMQVDAAGNVFLTGGMGGTIDADPGPNVANFTGNGILVEKLDSAGNYVWARKVDINQGGVMSMALDGVSSIFLTGLFLGTVDFNPGLGIYNLTAAGGNGDIFVEKLDSAGNFQWAKGVGGGSADWGQGIATDPLGNVLVTGYFNGTVDFDPGPGVSNLVSNSRDIFTLRLRNNGDFSWARGVNSTPGNDDGRAIATDGQGNVYTAAELLNPADVDPGSGVFTVGGHFVQKLDSSGNFAWATTLGGLPGWVGLDGNNSVYVTGAFSGTNVDFDPGPAVYPVSGSGYIEKFCISQPFTLLTDKTAMCSGDTAHLTTASQPGATYYWLNGGTVIPGSSNNDTLNATATGSYSVYVYGNGCPSGSDTVSLTVTPSVHPSITINAPASAPVGQQVTVTAMLTNAGTGYSINWYNKGIYQGTSSVPSFTYAKQQGNDTITAEIINSANPCYYPDTSNVQIVTVIDGIADVMTSLGLSIYPNPFTDIITIKGLKQKDIITITDISGRIIEAHAATGDVLTIKTDSLSAGYYILKIADEKGVKVNVPVVKR